jgi:predicted nucleotidyltransferase/HEPN domain-containing protein
VRKDIDHLPARDRRYLEHAVQVIRREFDAARRRKKVVEGEERRILKIVLYGSMARGNPVLDRETGYRSDYDLLVIVSHPELADPRWWEGAEDALSLEDQSGLTRYPVSVIVHDVDDVNNQLHLGRPFFKDIRRDGIVVYEFNKRELAQPGNLSPEEVHAEARMYFDQWFPKVRTSQITAHFLIGKGEFNDAAFNLHQACERAYHCVLLTLTLYTPKLHHIGKLRTMAEGIAPSLIAAWPRKTKWQRRPFNRLVRAYVEARYSPHYEITAEDLAAAAEQVASLQALVKAVCEERLGQSLTD